MANTTQLESFSTRELIEELRRRIAELDEARALLAGVGQSSSTAKSPKVSQAKAAYWKEWHTYKAAHPDATVEQWRKSQKSTKKAK